MATRRVAETLLEGSLKNIVHCSPGAPLNRSVGFTTNSVFAASRPVTRTQPSEFYKKRQGLALAPTARRRGYVWGTYVFGGHASCLRRDTAQSEELPRGLPSGPSSNLSPGHSKLTRHFIAIDWVVVFWCPVVLANPVAHNLVPCLFEKHPGTNQTRPLVHLGIGVNLKVQNRSTFPAHNVLLRSQGCFHKS